MCVCVQGYARVCVYIWYVRHVSAGLCMCVQCAYSSVALCVYVPVSMGLPVCNMRWMHVCVNVGVYLDAQEYTYAKPLL